MENDIKFYLIPNDEGEFEAYDCEYDITIVCKSKEEQDEAIKKIKKGLASLQAWDKVIEDIKKLKKDTACGLEAADKEIFNKGLETALDSIYLYMPEELNKHLQEE